MGEIGERATPVAHGDVEELRDRRGEAHDAQAPIEEQRGDVGGDEQVLQVVRQHPEFVDLVTVLLVERRQLLVHRLEFLTRGLEFLHRGSEFFVRRLQFLVRCPHLLLAGLVLLDDRLQPPARQVELPLEGLEHVEFPLVGNGRYTAGFR